MVPEGWKVAQLGELAKFSSGGTPSKQNLDLWGGDEPWISGKDLKSHYLTSSIDKLTLKGFSSAKKAPAGASLILVRGMTLLKDFPVGYATREVAFNQDLKALIPNENIDGLFLSFLLVAEKEKVLKLVSVAGHGTGRLDTTLIKSLIVQLPPYDEQKKIAKILSAWDKAIEITEKILLNSQQQKKSLMQKLLTEKKRLLDKNGRRFNSEWKSCRLGDIGEIKSAGVDKKIVEGEVPVRLLNFTDVFKKTFIFADEINHWVSAPYSKVDGCNVLKGDVFFTPSSETREEVGMSAVVAADIDSCCYSYHIVRFRIKENWDLNFKAFAFSTPTFRKQVSLLADGSGQRYVVSQDGFRSVMISYPPIEEQREIGKVLRLAEEETMILDKKLNLLKQEKKALMQQLLTGKRRVKTEVA